MEFGILSAERSGSFHEEEVVGRGASEKVGRLAGVGGGGSLKGLRVPSYPRAPDPSLLAGHSGFGSRTIPKAGVRCRRCLATPLPPPPRSQRRRLGQPPGAGASSSGWPRGGRAGCAPPSPRGRARHGGACVASSRAAAVIFVGGLPNDHCESILGANFKPSDLFHGGGNAKGGCCCYY